MKKFLGKLVADYGLMRLALYAFSLVLIILAPKGGLPETVHGWEFITTIVIPSIIPLIFMVLMFDVLMNKVVSSGKSDTEKKRFKQITIANLLVTAALILSILPYAISNLG